MSMMQNVVQHFLARDLYQRQLMSGSGSCRGEGVVEVGVGVEVADTD
jgi:hypothetical protein